jgi:hypothetical protein
MSPTLYLCSTTWLRPDCVEISEHGNASKPGGQEIWLPDHVCIKLATILDVRKTQSLQSLETAFLQFSFESNLQPCQFSTSRALIMASEVTTDGQVLPPLNISAPTPILNLRGFRWDTVDEEIHGPQLSREAMPPLRAQEPLQETAAQSPQLAKQLAKDEEPFLPGFPLAQFQGAYAGNGFNMIFRPRSDNDKSPLPIKPGPDAGPADNILELNLTTEQLTFGEPLGKIPNRGLLGQPDINLAGFPYLQTVQDVTNPDTGKGDRVKPIGIHFEPGMWLKVPAATFQTKSAASVVRMASIPHGTTVNAQGLVPARANTANTVLGGVAGPPNIGDVDTTPFRIGDPTARFNGTFKSMDADNQKTFRVPQNLEKFNDKGTKLITTDIIKNPNLVLKNVIKDQKITETISFGVSTGPPTAELNGGGTANISFLAGKQDPVTTAAPSKNDNPNAFAEFMKSTFWIERVEYQVTVPKTTQTTLRLKPTMPSNSTAPTPEFLITTPRGGISANKVITVPGIQIQYSQTVNLNFGPPGLMLTWPHVSVATLVPTNPQPFQMT